VGVWCGKSSVEFEVVRDYLKFDLLEVCVVAMLRVREVITL